MKILSCGIYEELGIAVVTHLACLQHTSNSWCFFCAEWQFLKSQGLTTPKLSCTLQVIHLQYAASFINILSLLHDGKQMSYLCLDKVPSVLPLQNPNSLSISGILGKGIFDYEVMQTTRKRHIQASSGELPRTATCEEAICFPRCLAEVIFMATS